MPNMQSAPVFRIPLLLAAALAMNRAFAQPPNRLTKEERAHVGQDTHEKIFSKYVYLMNRFVSWSAWIPAIADACIILHASQDIVPSQWKSVIESLPLGSISAPSGIPTSMLLGTPIAVAGAVLRRWSIATLGRHFTLRLSIRDTHKLITAAPYNIVRHPSYSGAFLASYGGLFALCAPKDSWMRSVWLPTLMSPEVPLLARVLGAVPTLLYALVFFYGTFVTFSRTSVEDRMMRDHFGKDWDKWAARVPYRMIPTIW